MWCVLICDSVIEPFFFAESTIIESSRYAGKLGNLYNTGCINYIWDCLKIQFFKQVDLKNRAQFFKQVDLKNRAHWISSKVIIFTHLDFFLWG